LPSITGFEDGGAVGNHRHQIGPGRQRGRLGGIGGDRHARRGDARRIGQRQVALVGERLDRLDLELARPRKAVISQGRGMKIF
jgi:hypothetical protein